MVSATTEMCTKGGKSGRMAVAHFVGVDGKGGSEKSSHKKTAKKRRVEFE